MDPARRRSPRATRPSSTAISTRCGRSSKSMSKVDAQIGAKALAGASPQYRDWVKRERRGRLSVRAAQLALLLAFLVLWEVLPRAHVINPTLTSYPSALWPTFLELLKATPREASILTHTASTVFATVLGFTAAMLL